MHGVQAVAWEMAVSPTWVGTRWRVRLTCLLSASLYSWQGYGGPGKCGKQEQNHVT